MQHAPASQSTLLCDVLLARGVVAKWLIYNHGDHSVELASGDKDVGHWPDLLRRWLRRRKLSTQKPRCAVAGRLLINDAPPANAWLAHEVLAPNAPRQEFFSLQQATVSA